MTKYILVYADKRIDHEVWMNVWCFKHTEQRGTDGHLESYLGKPSVEFAFVHRYGYLN